ncbi:MAG: MGMT family protein [Dysosmobacter sp.]|nr:MGMT family protein [Dysosmobacter sp.]
MSGGVFAVFYTIVHRISAGKAATYGQIARMAGMPRCARTVGYAMAGCQDPTVPCHRVVDRFGGTKSAFDTHSPGTQAGLAGSGGCDFPFRRHCKPGAVPVDPLITGKA